MNNPDVLVCYVDSVVYKVIKETVKSCFFDAETWIRILCNPIPPDEDDPDLTKYLKFKKAWFLLIPDQPAPRLRSIIKFRFIGTLVLLFLRLPLKREEYPF